MSNTIGESIYALANRLWPLNRSLTGNGVRETLGVVKELLPGLAIHEVPTGTPVFDWTVPEEWNARAAWVKDADGRTVIDFAKNNLHLVGYSVPIDRKMPLRELQEHLHSLPEQPDAIPYVTSYYARTWGFCLRHRDRLALKDGNYHVHIDASHTEGSLTYADLVIPGDTAEEVLLTTYICHPSMANNELSGPCVQTYIAKWLCGLPARRYTYRIIYAPETIGAITYLSRNLPHLKRHVIAGFNLTCLGDDRCYSYVPTRAGDTLSDQVALHVLRNIAPDFIHYTYLDRGSDERQYCAPGVDLPIATITRSKYDEYPEYHTSLDDLSVISPTGLQGGFDALTKAIDLIENNYRPLLTTTCEPQLGKRGLYPSLTKPGYDAPLLTMVHLIQYSDGSNTLLDIADKIKVPMWQLLPIYRDLANCGVLRDLSAVNS